LHCEEMSAPRSSAIAVKTAVGREQAHDMARMGSVGDVGRSISSEVLGISPSAKKFSKGRPPWYDSRGSIRKPVVVGVAGGSGSGKKSVCKAIIGNLQVQWAILLSMDSFYLEVERKDGQVPEVFDHNFDHPASLDWPLLLSTLQELKRGKNVPIPQYNMETLSRSTHDRQVYGADVILLEGTFALYDAQVRDLMDIKVFLETDSDVRLARRLRRDHHELGRDMYKVLEQYQHFVKPGYEDFVEPSRHFADIVIPRGIDNKVALKILTQHLQGMLEERGFRAPDLEVSKPTWKHLPANVHMLPQTPQILALHTIIRNQKTGREDFVFYSSRLSRLVVEHALSLLPVEKKVVETPTGAKYDGLGFLARPVAVSVVRAGEAMEEAVRDVLLDLPVGKILIQSKQKKPRLFYVKLPDNLADKHILLLDATLATGAAAKMAVRVLLDHGAREENIYFLALIASPQSLQSLLYTYPKVQIVVSQVDRGLSDQKFLKPGVGNFGNRFYGTEV